jgi:hypothetical protein
VTAYYRNTLEYIKYKKAHTGNASELAAKFAAIEL